MRMRAFRVYSGLYSDARRTPRCSRCVPAPVPFGLSFVKCFCGILGHYLRVSHIGVVLAPVWIIEVFLFQRLCGDSVPCVVWCDTAVIFTYVTLAPDGSYFSVVSLATNALSLSHSRVVVLTHSRH